MILISVYIKILAKHENFYRLSYIKLELNMKIMEKKVKSISQELLLAFLTAKGTDIECPLEEVEDFIVNDDSGYSDTNFCNTEALDNWLHSWSNYDVIQDDEDEECHTYTIANAAGTITITTGHSLWEYKKEMGY